MSEPAKKAASQKESKEAPVRSSADELLSLADLEQAAANFEGAIRTYRQVLDGTVTLPEKARALRGVGSCLERIGRWKEALNVLEDAAVAARQAESDDELGKVLIKLGKIHFGQGHIDVALRCGNEALALIDPKTDPSSRGFALNLLGSAFNRQGDLDQSAQCFRQALSAFKGAGDIRSLSLAYNNLGLIYKEKCDWRMALEYLQVAASLKAIEGDYPERRGDLKNLGLVYYKMGNWDRARECFAESLEVSRSVNDPIEVIRALLGVAGVDLVHRRWDDALEGLEQALELCSDEQYPRETALTYRSLGQLHQARGELSRARRCLEVAWRKAVESSPEGDLARELLRLRAELALTEGQDADAANLARRAVELSSRFNDRMETALAKVTLGRVLLHQGDAKGYQELSEAEEELRRLASPLPLAQVLLEQGRQRLRANHELPRAEALLVEAREILAELSLHEMEVETLIALSNVSSRRGELDRAGEFLEQARTRVSGLDSPSILALLAEAQKDLEHRLVETSVTNLGAFRTAGRLEEIVESRRPYADKLNQVLEIMAQAVEADGASLVFVAEDQPGATYRIGSEAAQRLTAVLRSLRPERPEILLDAGNGGAPAVDRGGGDPQGVLASRDPGLRQRHRRVPVSGSPGRAPAVLVRPEPPEPLSGAGPAARGSGRPRRDGERHQPGGRGQPAPARVPGRCGDPEPGDDRDPEAGGEGEPHGSHRAASGRNRHRQDPHRPRAPSLQQPRGGSVRDRRLRRAPREPSRERAVRLREGRLHRREPRQEGALRGGRRRHHLPGRDRQGGSGRAAPPAAPSRSGRGPPGRIHAVPQAQREGDRRHQQEGSPRAGRRSVHQGPLLPSQRHHHPRARRCASAPRTFRF